MMREYLITSEDSSSHWSFFPTEAHNILDLGCGRWYTKDIDELSPIYFGKKARKVVGVDSNCDDVEFYKSYTLNDPKYSFLCQFINNADQVRSLLVTYEITALKCDIEGGEAVLLDLTVEDLKDVEHLGIEFHSEELKKSFLDKVLFWGYKIELIAKFAQTPDYMGVIFCSKL